MEIFVPGFAPRKQSPETGQVLRAELNCQHMGKVLRGEEKRLPHRVMPGRAPLHGQEGRGL